MRSHKRVYNSLYQKAPSAKGHCRIFHTPAFEHGVPCNGLVLFRAENQTYRRIIAFHFAVLFVHADITVHLADILMGEFSDFENCSALYPLKELFATLAVTLALTLAAFPSLFYPLVFQCIGGVF